MKNTITFLIAFLLIVPLTKASTLNLAPPVKKIFKIDLTLRLI